MSGGSRGYSYLKFDHEYKGRMFDDIMNELIKDLIPVLKSVEWYESGDNCLETYKEDVKVFKDKWIDNISETKQIIINQIKKEAIDRINEVQKGEIANNENAESEGVKGIVEIIKCKRKNLE